MKNRVNISQPFNTAMKCHIKMIQKFGLDLGFDYGISFKKYNDETEIWVQITN